VLGSFDNLPHNHAIESLNRLPLSQVARNKPTKQNQNLSDLARQDWAELPYAMMRLTANSMRWDDKHLYWRDRIVQLGEIDLTLKRHRSDHQAPHFAAVYRLEESRRDFELYPSIEDGQLRWTTPGLCDTAKLTTPQLAEKLLGKLVNFYTQGLP